MDFEPFQYMRYAKRLEYADGIFMAGSGMNKPKRDVLSFREADFSLDSLCSNYGDPRNIAWLAARYGTTGEHVVMTAGSSEANFLVYAAALNAGDKVIIETPGYPQFTSLASMLNAEVVHLPRRYENGYEPDIAEFKKLLDDGVRLVVLTNLHNPTMARMPRDLMKEIVDLCAVNGTLVLIDEVYVDHLKPGDDDQSAFELGDNVVVTNSLTKVYGLSGLRFGWAVGPKKLLSKMLDLIDIVDPELPTITQNLAHHALENLARLRPAARRLHEQNWPIVKEWADSRDDIEYFHPPGGITVWLRVKDITETGNLSTVARNDYGVLVVPGEYFQSPGWLRVGYKIEPTAVREGLSRLGKAIDDFKSHR
ncbi:MAG: pyridoxal phosphate-dependent aminotransferase [Planctomycetes bacterium]|nr:pyridoxal phosphate-dependent aminotransferase [Planctomycetota bacterium]